VIAIIDSGVSNIGSVLEALARVNAPAHVVHDPSAVMHASAIILPGVGSFGDGMAGLRRRGLVAPLQAAARAGTPTLGICLGMQLLVEESEEHGHHKGLGLLPGGVRRLASDEPGCNVPNMGWCDVTVTRAGTLFPDAANCESFYFVHSYTLETSTENVVATVPFGGRRITAAIEANNICGVQFHPEKSQDAGLDLLARWAARRRIAA
jgi:glutamine amidotransferase